MYIFEDSQNILEHINYEHRQMLPQIWFAKDIDLGACASTHCETRFIMTFYMYYIICFLSGKSIGIGAYLYILLKDALCKTKVKHEENMMECE